MVSPKNVLAFALILAASPVGARIYCCNDEHGRRVCGDILPEQCQVRAYNEFNSQGVLKKQYEAPLTHEQRVARDAELARKKAAELEATEQARHDRALVASYSSVEDIDDKLRRTLVGTHAEIKNAQERLETTQARHEKLMKAAAHYGADKPMPEALKANITDNNDELVTRQAALDAKKKEVDVVQQRFAHDRVRFLQLTGKAPPEPAPAAPVAPAR